MTTEVAAAAIVRNGRVLGGRRTAPASAAGFWEFPGGKVRPNETGAQAVVREVREELSCRVEVVAAVGELQQIGPTYHLRLYLARLVAGEPLPVEHDMVRWFPPEELTDVTWLPADCPLLPLVRQILLDEKRADGAAAG